MRYSIMGERGRDKYTRFRITKRYAHLYVNLFKRMIKCYKINLVYSCEKYRIMNDDGIEVFSFEKMEDYGYFGNDKNIHFVFSVKLLEHGLDPHLSFEAHPYIMRTSRRINKIIKRINILNEVKE